MRTIKDRIRHTILFEVIAILSATFLGGWVLNQPPEMMGVVSVVLSAIAMIWNYVFNWLFDLWNLKVRGGAKRTVPVRIAHALLFEAFLYATGTVFIAWWLEITLLHSAVVGLGFSVFFLIYAYIYNWLYDLVFPIPQSVEV